MNKNIKISTKHHEILKAYCNRTGMKMYKVIEKWIDELDRSKKDEIIKSKKKDIYDEG